MHQLTEREQRVFNKYVGLSLPRHVAYPMPTWWKDVDADQARALRELSLSGDSKRDLSLYLHIPFCERMCRFCACNRIIVRKDGPSRAGRIERYLQALTEELKQRAADVGENGARLVRQIHWGGGTPTYLECGEIRHLHESTAELFQIAPDAEISIEVDPRVTTAEQLETLRALGFNRISLGVQDFNAEVQEHIGRVQPFELVRETVERSRALGFDSVNFDLIYGLPLQTTESVADMLDRTMELRPDRIAFYHYAQIPDRIANQRGLDNTLLPNSEVKLQMLLLALERLGVHGYEFIGLDHFALPDERLAKALESGDIVRSFQGMTTGAELDLFGFGCSAISVLPRRMYLQNQHEVNAYVDAMLEGGEAAFRGKALTDDDAVRQSALMQLYCRGEVDPIRLKAEAGADFAEYFAQERPQLDRLADDGLLESTENGGVRLTFPLGRVLMRNVAAVFDGYLHAEAPWTGMEKTFSASA